MWVTMETSAGSLLMGLIVCVTFSGPVTEGGVRGCWCGEKEEGRGDPRSSSLDSEWRGTLTVLSRESESAEVRRSGPRVP